MFLSRNLFKNWFRKAKMTASGALRASPASSTTQRQQAFEFGFFCFIVFCDFAVVTHFAPIRFYKQTTLRTEAFAQSSLYAQILLHREVCAQIDFYTQTPLHRGFYVFFFAHINFYTPMLCRKMHLHAQIKAHRRFYTQNLLQRETFAQNNFYTDTFTQENFDTEKLVHTDCTKKMPPTVLHAEKLFWTEAFTRRSHYAQQFLHRPFYPQMPLLRKTFTHRNFCTQHTFTHSKLLITRRGFASPS